jgi:Tfp pilus assembly protein PilV
MAKRGAIRAFTMIEVTLALGVAGFCLLSIVGLLPVGLTSNQASIEQTMAVNISSALVSDLRTAQPMGANISPRFGLPIPAAGAGSSMHTVYLASDGAATTVDTPPVTSGSSISRYRATILFYPPANNPQPAQRTATEVRVLITWPALADTNYAKAPANYTGSYEAETALDRN